MVPFDNEVLYACIEDNFVAYPWKLDPFSIHLAKGNLDYDHIATDECETGKTYKLRPNGRPIHFKKSDLINQS